MASATLSPGDVRAAPKGSPLTLLPSERDSHGRQVRLEGGVLAWIPGPLPPTVVWNERLVTTLSRADRAVGHLAGEGRGLSNPHMFIRPFLRREAVLSSRIEGTQTTLRQLLAADADNRKGTPLDDLLEVVNYVSALEYGLDDRDSLPLSLPLVQELHRVLMRDARGGTAAPGEFRTIQNWIGRAGCDLEEATYVPPPPEEVLPCLSALESFLHNDRFPPIVHAALVHAQFEAIHPFEDGNGRVGRLLIVLMFLERGVLPSPLLYLSAWFEREREEYYERLLAVTQRGDWEGWLLYFARGVEEQAEDVVARIRFIGSLVEDWKRALSGARSAFLHRVLDLFAEQPYWNLPGLARALDTTYTTAQRSVRRLEALGAVEPVAAGRRNRVYAAPAILDALDAPSAKSLGD